jgi:hypothetical protein
VLVAHDTCSAAEEAETATVEVAWAVNGDLKLCVDSQQTKPYYSLADRSEQGKLIALHGLAFDTERISKSRWAPPKNRLKPHGRSWECVEWKVASQVDVVIHCCCIVAEFPLQAQNFHRQGHRSQMSVADCLAKVRKTCRPWDHIVDGRFAVFASFALVVDSPKAATMPHAVALHRSAASAVEEANVNVGEQVQHSALKAVVVEAHSFPAPPFGCSAHSNGWAQPSLQAFPVFLVCMFLDIARLAGVASPPGPYTSANEVLRSRRKWWDMQEIRLARTADCWRRRCLVYHSVLLQSAHSSYSGRRRIAVVSAGSRDGGRSDYLQIVVASPRSSHL